MKYICTFIALGITSVFINSFCFVPTWFIPVIEWLESDFWKSSNSFRDLFHSWEFIINNECTYCDMILRINFYSFKYKKNKRHSKMIMNWKIKTIPLL